MAFEIEFEVNCQTRFGEIAVICGNLPDLGQWAPQKGHRLETDNQYFPLWTSPRSLIVKEGTTVEFKLCLLNSTGALVRWQSIGANRIFSPRTSLTIIFAQSQGSTICRALCRRMSGMSGMSVDVVNVRKGTEEVINDLASDSSSNRQMWKEHKLSEEEERELLFKQFTQHLKKAVATQREQLILPLQLEPEMQLQTQIHFGNFETHKITTHYFVISKPMNEFGIDNEGQSDEKIVILSSDKLQRLKLKEKGEVSIFHFLDGGAGSNVSCSDQLQKVYQLLGNEKVRGLVVLYVEEEQSHDFSSFIGHGVDVITCFEHSAASAIARQSVAKGYNILSSGRDQFLVFEGDKFVLKVIIYPLKKGSLLDDVSKNLAQIKPYILDGFFLKYSESEVRKQLRSTLKTLNLPFYHCVIVTHVKRLDDLSVKIIGDLIQLSSLKYDVVVIVLTHQKFPRNIRDKVPTIKNRMLVLNTEGEIYYNGKETADLYTYLEISKNKFEENITLISEQIGSGIVVHRALNSQKATIEFPKGPFGDLLKERALKCIKDINKKSLAKIIACLKEKVLELMPFVLHPTFLLKVALTTFTGRLRGDEKGLVISIEDDRFSQKRWLQPPEGREINIQFCRFGLSEEEKRYGSAPLQEESFQKLLDVIADLEQEKKKQNQSIISQLIDIKNIF